MGAVIAIISVILLGMVGFFLYRVFKMGDKKFYSMVTKQKNKEAQFVDEENSVKRAAGGPKQPSSVKRE